MHEMNAYRAGHVCLSVRLSVRLSIRMIQFENHWTDLDELWYGRYVIGDYPKIVHYNFLQSVIPIWRAKKLERWNRH
jgi:hypothetical protein